MINTNIKILLIEDNEADKILIERQIKKIVSSPQIIHSKNFDDIKLQLEISNPIKGIYRT